MAVAADIVRRHAETLAQRAGLDLITVEVKGSGPRTLVRVKVDRKGGVALTECQQLSRDLSRALDEDDPIDSRYQLEVSSPGVSHPLRSQRDFDRVEGRVVTLRLHGAESGTEITGTVRDAGETHVVIATDDADLPVAYDDIDNATQALPW